jgi:plasmid stabilization system protein ParE
VTRIAVIFSPRAKDFMSGEARYWRTVAKRPDVAKAFRAQMKGAARLLSEHPESGSIGLTPDTRVLVVRPIYLMHYRVERTADGTPAEVQVFAIRSARQGDAQTPWSDI